MKLSDFDYYLPTELIAQKPVRPRDSSRLMVLDHNKKTVRHKHFYDILDCLNQGDVLVLNNTKVFPARLIGRRQKTGGKTEVFLLKEVSVNSSGKANIWEVLIGNRRKKIGQIIEFAKGLKVEIIKQIDESVWQVKFNKSGKALEKIIDQIGQVPTPPYIKIQPTRYKRQITTNKIQTTNYNQQDTNDKIQTTRYNQQDTNNKTQISKKDYQTVYAKERGSVAAPTAGLHFTRTLINKLKRKGVQFEFITLRVGFGTFEPVKVANIKKHKMHTELATLDKETAKRLNQAKNQNRRIIAVGTTSARTLEAFAKKNGQIQPKSKWVDIFIYPGYKFKFVDALITNFHLPKSTLLMLVSALTGTKFIKKMYQIAVKKKYRFFSFGDAMFISHLPRKFRNLLQR